MTLAEYQAAVREHFPDMNFAQIATKFANVDTDKDSHISLEEWIHDYKTFVSPVFVKDPDESEAMTQFKTLDLNHDHFLNETEFCRFLEPVTGEQLCHAFWMGMDEDGDVDSKGRMGMGSFSTWYLDIWLGKSHKEPTKVKSKQTVQTKTKGTKKRDKIRKQ